MLVVETIAKIRRAHFVQGKPIKQICRELKLSRLTRWVLDADAAGVRYALELPGSRIELDNGPAHRQRCLEALALA